MISISTLATSILTKNPYLNYGAQSYQILWDVSPKSNDYQRNNAVQILDKVNSLQEMKLDFNLYRQLLGNSSGW